jgi:HSP20 family protein
LPGVEDMTIEVVGRTLVIKAERKVVHDTDADMVHSVERSYGKVQRTILLPENADIDKAISKFVDGVLTVSFPKKNMDIPFTKKLMISNR